jgi:hypothetical protein
MNKSNLLVLCGLLLVGNAYAQQKAVTDKGTEVFLYDDGTWKYVNESEVEKTEIPTNPVKFIKDPKSTFLLKSSKVDMGFYINPKKWTFEKENSESISEYSLRTKNSDLYGMIVTERLEVPLESLKEIAVDNAKNAAPDVAVVKEEYRNVNGLKVLCLQMNGTIKGIKFTYLGYYYSSASGTIQFLTYSTEELVKQNMFELESLLNGLTKLN